MIASFFHHWERRLAAVSESDRVVRPFEWGLEWMFDAARESVGSRPLAVGSGRAPIVGRPTAPEGRQSAGTVHSVPIAVEDDPERSIDAWVVEALADSSAFFDAPPTAEYALRTDATGTRTLVYPSHFVTPNPENNLARARYFPARPPKRGRGPRRAVVVLPQWNSDAGSHVGLCEILARFGVSALRLSLPYHDERMPPELSRADYIVSSNVVRTVQVCRQAVMDARRAIHWLASQGYERIGLLGTSLGSCLAMLTAAHEPLVRAQALNHVSPYFADVVWEGLSTAHVRAGLDGHITLDRLRRLWLPISPQSYLDRIRDKRTLLVYALYDLTFPVRLSRWLVADFRRMAIPHEVVVLPCGHYSTGIAPFKYVDGYVLVRFLLRSL